MSFNSARNNTGWHSSSSPTTSPASNATTPPGSDGAQEGTHQAGQIGCPGAGAPAGYQSYGAAGYQSYGAGAASAYPAQYQGQQYAAPAQGQAYQGSASGYYAQTPGYQGHYAPPAQHGAYGSVAPAAGQPYLTPIATGQSQGYRYATPNSGNAPAPVYGSSALGGNRVRDGVMHQDHWYPDADTAAAHAGNPDGSDGVSPTLRLKRVHCTNSECKLAIEGKSYAPERTNYRCPSCSALAPRQ